MAWYHIVVIGIAVFLLSAVSVSAVWCNVSFPYQSNITELTGNTYTDRFAELRVNTSQMIAINNMTATCSDLVVFNTTCHRQERKVINCNQLNTSVYYNHTSGGAPYILGSGCPSEPLTDRNLTYWGVQGYDFDSYVDSYNMYTDAEWLSGNPVSVLITKDAYWGGSPTGNQTLVLNDTDAGTAGETYWNPADVSKGVFKTRVNWFSGIGDPYFMMIRTGAADEIIIIQLDHNNNDRLLYYDSGGANTLAYIVPNTWYNLSLEFDGVQAKFNITLDNLTDSIRHNGRNYRDGQHGFQQIHFDTGTTNKWFLDDFYLIDTTELVAPVLRLESQEFYVTTTTTTPTIPAIEDFDYCQLLWLEQNAGVLANHNWCLDNQTIASNITFEINVDGNVSIIVSYSEEICRWGCDNRTNSCSPSPVGQYGIWLGWVLIILLAIGIIAWLWRRI